jgi:hypothetical protein
VYHARVSRPALTLAFLTILAACSSDRRMPATAASTAPVRVEAAPADGEVAPLVRARREAVVQAGGKLLVYVGATWCEPCRAFHAAATRGDLDKTFPGLVLLEFDLDRDRDRLLAAGYTSRLVPLFARPDDEGRSSGVSTEGVRTGSDAVADLLPRLAELLR